LWPLNSVDLSPIVYKIYGIIQQRAQSTKVQDVKDLMQRLIDAFAGVEESFIQNVTDHRRRRLHTCIQLQEDIMNIHCDKNYSERLN